MNRRSQERCEVCHGPTKLKGDQIICRNSLCAYNHRDVICPRCGASGVEATDYKQNQVNYKCSDCQHLWQSS